MIILPSERIEDDFEYATKYFDLNPQEIKIRREEWKKLRADSPENSYIKIINGPVLRISRKELGLGGSYHAKQAVDQNGNVYALLIAKRHEYMTHTYLHILRDLKLSIGDMTTRIVAPKIWYDKYKSYQCMLYLGISLGSQLLENALASNEKIMIATKLCWELHKLHTGVDSLSNTRYYHGDLSAGNVVLDAEKNPKLIDFGRSAYLSGDNDVQLQYDNTALRRLLIGIFGEEYGRLEEESRCELDPVRNFVLSWPHGATALSALDMTLRLIAFQTQQPYDVFEHISEADKVIYCERFFNDAQYNANSELKIKGATPT